jgi:hypothetical protein
LVKNWIWLSKEASLLGGFLIVGQAFRLTINSSVNANGSRRAAARPFAQRFPRAFSHCPANKPRSPTRCCAFQSIALNQGFFLKSEKNIITKRNLLFTPSVSSVYFNKMTDYRNQRY